MTHAPVGARLRAPLALLIVVLVALATAILPASGARADETPPPVDTSEQAPSDGTPSSTGEQDAAGGGSEPDAPDTGASEPDANDEDAPVPDDSDPDVHSDDSHDSGELPGDGDPAPAASSVAAADSAPAIDVAITSASAADGAVLHIQGSGFTGISGAYAAIIEEGTEAAVSAGGGYLAFGYWMPPAAGFTADTFDRTLTTAAADLDREKLYEVIVWQGHTTPDASTIYARADVPFGSSEWNALFPPQYGITVDAANAESGSVSVTGVFPTSYTATSGSTLTTGVYLMYCIQPADEPGSGGAGRAGGSGNCASASQKWVVQPGVAAAPGTTQTGTVDGGVWTFTTEVAVAPEIGDHGCLDATAVGDGGVACGIAVRLDHTSGSGANATYTFDGFAPVFFAAPAPAPRITVAVTGASEADGLEVEVRGTGFSGIAGAYAAIIEEGTEAGVSAGGGSLAFGFWMPPAAGFTGDTFERTLTAASADLDPDADYEVIVWQGHTTPDASTIYDRAVIALTDEQAAALFPSDEPELPSDPVVTPPTVTPAAGSLSWGVKASFREYVLGPIAGGSITTSGVGSSGGGYLFPQSSGPSTSGASYSGSVRFTGHGGALDLTLSSPRVRIDSAMTATLFVRVDGAEVAFATLALGSPSTGSGGSVRYSGASATLTAAGAAAFDGFYGAGTALDPVSFVLGSAGGALGGTTVLASSFASTTPSNTPDPSPPATEGIELTDGEAVEGGEITITAEGFQPGETGILVVIYSEPTVLARDASADATGTVTWTGSLPRGLTGRHTLTLQGSVDRGLVLEVASAEQPACTVNDAALVWGVKESFRAYIDGSIANGEWTTSGDVSYQTPVFTWTAGEGGTGSAARTDVAFRGAIRFTGHDGALDTTLADPRIVIDGSVAHLLLDVTGTTQEGAVIDARAVPFAELDLSTKPERADDMVRWLDVPVTLTAQGAEAFGSYPAGEELDPITLTVTAAPGCSDAAADPEGTEPTAAVTETAGWPLWATIAILVALLVVVAVILAVTMRRRAA